MLSLVTIIASDHDWVNIDKINNLYVIIKLIDFAKNKLTFMQ